jgi:hypothetical protein
MKCIIRSWLALEICLLSLPVLAAPLNVGDAVPEISAKDQHGAAYAFTNGTAFLLIATEMASAKAANQKLAEQGAGFLEKHDAALLMDIHTMPGIARLFALPKMRKYPQRIVLVEKAQSLDWVPVKPGHVTVLSLTAEGRIKQISYWNSGSDPVTGLFP